MRIKKAAIYKNDTTGEVRSFVWYEATHIGTPPVVLQLRFDEIPRVKADPSAGILEQDEKVRVELPDEETDQHAKFLDTDFKDGNWKLVEDRPVVVDIPLPDISEMPFSKTPKSLLDSAQRYFADAKRYPDI